MANEFKESQNIADGNLGRVGSGENTRRPFLFMTFMLEITQVGNYIQKSMQKIIGRYTQFYLLSTFLVSAIDGYKCLHIDNEKPTEYLHELLHIDGLKDGLLYTILLYLLIKVEMENKNKQIATEVGI